MTSERPLTARQAEVYQLILDAFANTGAPPTRAEIARELGFASANAAEDHLRALEKKGVIQLVDGIARGIRLVEPPPPPGLPLVGRVAAGAPILAEAHIDQRFQIDPALFDPPADYLLRVRGTSMRDAGIHDGDLLVVHRQSEARNGQIVVARLHDEVTVKRYRRQGSRVELLPENPDFQPIVVDPHTEPLAIEGLAVGLIRNGRLA